MHFRFRAFSKGRHFRRNICAVSFLWAVYRLKFLPHYFQTSYVSCWWWEERPYSFWFMTLNVIRTLACKLPKWFNRQSPKVDLDLWSGDLKSISNLQRNGSGGQTHAPTHSLTQPHTNGRLCCCEGILYTGKILPPFYFQILNLNLFMPIYYHFDTFTTAAYFVYYWTNLWRNFTVDLFYLVNIHNFPLNESKFPESRYCKCVWFIYD